MATTDQAPSDKPVVTRAFSADGRTLTLTATVNGLDVSTQTTWSSASLARTQAPAAESEFIERLAGMAGPSKNVMKRVGPMYVQTSIGPPTWWRPRIHWYRDGRGHRVFGAGWLRASISVVRAGVGVKITRIESTDEPHV